MDVFKIDRSLTGNLGRGPSPDKINPPEITFEAGSEFNLCFFDGPDDRGGFSDPSSVGSTTEGGSPPPQLHIPPLGASSGLVSPPGVPPTTSITIKTEQHYAVADSNSSSTTKTFVPCKVCGDKASGYHYGVTSCEGCKGFFRRSIQKQIEYRCLRDGKCLVIRLNRNRCQYCRFKKCLAVGMSRDSVRYGRVPKRSREERVTTADADQSEPEPKPTKKQMSVYDVIMVVSQAHLATCGYTEEKMRDMVRKPLIPPPAVYISESEVASSTVDASEVERCWLWQHFAVKVMPSIQKTVEFGKRVPGFGDLCQDDQLILIKVGFFEIWLSHVARWSVDEQMTFDDGTTVNKQQLQAMYDEDFASTLMNFASSFNDLSLNDLEMALFSAVILLTSDRVALTDVKAIENYQDKIIDALKVQVDRNQQTDPQRLSKILMKLPELRCLSAKHTAHLDWFRSNWRKLTLPPLFAEIFDIPKPEDTH